MRRWIVLLSLCTGCVLAAPVEKWPFPRLGEVTVYSSAGTPREVVLFLSGDGGWNLGVVSMAQILADNGALVAGIDIRRFLAALEKAPGQCVSPDGDLENLSHYLQAKAGIESYLEPTVVGYSSGATLAYAILAQSPANLFKGALSLGFCPDLNLKAPMCKGSGLKFTRRKDQKGRLQGVNFLPAKALNGQWIALQGALDQVCSADATAKFLHQVPGAELIALPAVGHGFGEEKNWRPQFESAFDRVASSPQSKMTESLAESVADLPLHEIAAAAGSRGDRLAVFLSGDGGWATLDREVSRKLAAAGVPVVGWDSLRYFWTARTPLGAAADLERVMRHYLQAWKKSKVLLVGYSQGADTMPFMRNRLPQRMQDTVDLIALLGLSDSAYFEFHVSHWLGNASGGLPVEPELEHWDDVNYVCIYGDEEVDSYCRSAHVPRAHVIELPGGHHYSGGYDILAEKILHRLRKN